jgi:hypothetical protein
MAVHTIEAGIQPAPQKPRIITIGKGSVVNGMKVFIPAQQFSSELGPELVGVLNGLFIQLLIFSELA